MVPENGAYMYANEGTPRPTGRYSLEWLHYHLGRGMAIVETSADGTERTVYAKSLA